MNYESMSDFEINKAVAEKLGYTIVESFKWEDSQCWVKVEKERKPAEIFDYCGDANDAWPIILSNNINLLKYEDVDGDEWEAQAGAKLNAFGYEGSSCEFYYYDKNPLRAAMIVFLMMQND